MVWHWGLSQNKGVRVSHMAKFLSKCIAELYPLGRDKSRIADRFITLVYALKSGARLCGQKFAQDFSFKIHLFL
jgi:hypothetical protein